MCIKILNNIYKLKYIKFDYRNINYHLIQCWKYNDNVKIFNIDFMVNKRLNYIKINNLSINNDYHHNNKNDNDNNNDYHHNNDNNNDNNNNNDNDNNNDKYNKIILLENTLIINKYKFYVDIVMNKNIIELNKIIIDDTKLKTNDYNLYNYNIEKIIDNNEYKIIKKIIFTYLCTYANYININNIKMTIDNNKKRYNAELKEEGFNIDYNYQFNNKNKLNIIKMI